MKKTYNELTMPQEIRNSINQSITIIKNKLKSNALKILLFGSYAREDYNKSSDIDLFVLVTNPREEANEVLNSFFDEIYDVDLENNVVINPLIENIDFYNQYQNELFLFENINNEGVLLYEQ